MNEYLTICGIRAIQFPANIRINPKISQKPKRNASIRQFDVIFTFGFSDISGRLTQLLQTIYILAQDTFGKISEHGTKAIITRSHVV